MSALDCIGKRDIADRKHAHFSFVLTGQPAEIVLKVLHFIGYDLVLVLEFANQLLFSHYILKTQWAMYENLLWIYFLIILFLLYN